MGATRDSSSDAAAAIADAVRARRLAAQNDPTAPAAGEGRTAEAGGHAAAMELLAQLRREQKQTANRVVGLAAEPTREDLGLTSTGKP
jgi:hypothetical protein